MRKILKSILFIAFGIIVILFIVILSSYTYHQIQLTKEKEEIQPTGEIVEVNGHDMHVHIEGEGDEVLIFMAGGGISSPVLDFKTLFDQLKGSYKIVVVEKAGYGFSDVTEEPRDLDVILAETREALRKSNVDGPYILVPHSMSGIEALYFAQRKPEEVKAIIGLDMAVPAAYEDYAISMPLVHVSSFIANTGIHRFIPGLVESSAVTNGKLEEEEKELYKTIAYRRTSTENMVNEVRQIKGNAKLVNNEPIPEVPMLLFVSNGEDTGMDKREWVNTNRNFSRMQENNEQIELDSPHAVHNHRAKEIAEKMQEFIHDLQNR